MKCVLSCAHVVIDVLWKAGKQELGFIMVMQSTEALMGSEPMIVHHGASSRTTLGKTSGGHYMIGPLGAPMKMLHFAEGFMADVTAIGETAFLAPPPLSSAGSL